MDNIRTYTALPHYKRRTLPPPISSDAISSTLQLENGILKVASHLPKIHNLSTTIDFDAHKMKASIHKGTAIDSPILSGNVFITNLWQYPAHIAITGEAEGDAANIIQFVKKPKKISKRHADFLKNLYDMKGKCHGTFALNFPIKRSVSYRALNLEVKAQLKDIEFSNLTEAHNLSNGDFDFNLSPQKIHLTGSAHLNDVSIPSVKFEYFFTPKNDVQMQHTIKGNFTSSDFEKIGIANLDSYLHSPTKVTATSLYFPNHQTISIRADLKKSEISIPPLRFYKAPNTKGLLEANVTLADRITIDSFSLKGDNFTLEGSARIAADKKSFSDATLSKAVFDKNNYTATYHETADEYALSLKGKQLDLSQKSFNEKNGKTPKKQSKNIRLDIQKIFMKNDIELTDVKANIKCNEFICDHIEYDSKLNQKFFISAGLTPLHDRNNLIIESDNAGLLLRGLDISNHIKGGDLNIQSVSFFDEKTGKIRSEGELIIEDFTAVKTPILGKLLTLASLKGISDLLNDKGITFKRFSAPFAIVDNIITVKSARSEGSSLGITANGTIDRSKEMIDLEGAIIPAQTLNRFLGRIPIIGKIVTGTKNEGVIATRYSIQGSFEDAKVKTHPLSILTPGVLRDFFGAIKLPKKTSEE